MCKKEKTDSNDILKQIKTVNLDDKLIQLHRTYQVRLNSHRTTLWEIQKHFTWWISIAISTMVLIYLSDNIIVDLDNKSKLIIIGSTLGIFFSILGFIVACREGKNFDDALTIVRGIEKRLNIPEISREKVIRFLFSMIYILAFFSFITLIILTKVCL